MMSWGCEILIVLSTHHVTLSSPVSNKIMFCCQSIGVLGTGGILAMSIL